MIEVIEAGLGPTSVSLNLPPPTFFHSAPTRQVPGGISVRIRPLTAAVAGILIQTSGPVKQNRNVCEAFPPGVDLADRCILMDCM